MANIANLIYGMSSNRPNLANSFMKGAQVGQARDLNNLKMQAAQQEINKQSKLQSLISSGADPMQIAAIDPTLGAAVADIQEKTSPAYKNKKFWEEQRSAATQDVRQFNKESKDMLSDYNSLNNNAALARNGDRGARNAMTVSVGRLMSPGIFTETEATALSGGQTPVQAIYQTLMGKGDKGKQVWDDLSKYVDPYGESFNADGLLNIGENIVLSRADPLLSSYRYASDRAKRADIPQNQYNTIFGENPYAPELERLLNEKQVNSEPAPSARVKQPTRNGKGWQLMTDANGNKAYVSPDGSQFEEVK